MEAMTLERVWHWHATCMTTYEQSGESALADQHRNLAEAIRPYLDLPHLAQPAQAVDVEKVAAVGYEAWMDDPGLWLHANNMERSRWTKIAQAIITRALSGEKAGPVGDGKARAFALHAAVGAIYFADSSDYLSALWEVVRELAPDLVDELSVDPSAVWHRTMAATDRFTLPASPTPDKEGA